MLVRIAARRAKWICLILLVAVLFASARIYTSSLRVQRLESRFGVQIECESAFLKTMAALCDRFGLESLATAMAKGGLPVYLRGSRLTSSEIREILKISSAWKTIDLPCADISENDLLKMLEFKDLGAVLLHETTFGDAHASVLSRHTTLSWVMIDNTFITDEGVRCLARMKSIRALSLSGTHITDSAIEEISQSSISILDCCECKFVSANVGVFQRFRRLEHLLLDSRQATAEVVSVVSINNVGVDVEVSGRKRYCVDDDSGVMGF